MEGTDRQVFSERYAKKQSKTDRRKAECIIIRGKAEEIVAACVFEVNGAVGFSENVATIASCNGIGLGGVLFSRSLLEIFSRGCNKDYMWIWEHNTESRRMTERFAMLTGRFSQQLLLEKPSNLSIDLDT